MIEHIGTFSIAYGQEGISSKWRVGSVDVCLLPISQFYSMVLQKIFYSHHVVLDKEILLSLFYLLCWRIHSVKSFQNKRKKVISEQKIFIFPPRIHRKYANLSRWQQAESNASKTSYILFRISFRG